VITVNLSFMNIDSLNRMIERMRLEKLIQKADFSDEVSETGIGNNYLTDQTSAPVPEKFLDFFACQ